MLFSRSQPLSGPVKMAAVLLLWTSLATAQLIAVDYCSNLNTATTPGNYSDWQTQGLCTLFCKDRKFGLAILQKNNCWCSSIMPANDIQVSTKQCQNPCPGFPADVCGGDKAFAYMRLNANPVTATKGSAVDEKTSSSTSTSTSTSATGPTRRPTPIIETVTVDGTVKTVTAPAPDSSDTTPESNRSNRSDGDGGGGGIGGGAIAGIVIGVLAILAIGGIVGFLVMRRKKRQGEEAHEESSNPRGSGAAMAHVPRSPDGGDGFGGRSGGRRPTNGTYGSDHSSGRRSSMLMPGDPRMNQAPGIYGRPDMNKSHDSFLSMQDNRDYSRPVHEPTKVLKVTNASPDDLD